MGFINQLKFTNLKTMNEEYFDNSNVLNTLDKMQFDLMQSCNKNCRYAASVLVGTTWLLLIEKNINVSIAALGPKYAFGGDILLFIALSCAVLFIVVDAWRQYSLSSKIRKIHSDCLLGKENVIGVVAKTNADSDISFHHFLYQLLLCGVSVIALSLYLLLIFLQRYS